MKKFLVCGGRDFGNIYYRDPKIQYKTYMKTGQELLRAKMEIEFIYYQLDRLTQSIHKDEILIITGDAKGVDTVALEWAMSRGIKSKAYPAKWKTYGNKAGPIRNQLMLDSELVDIDTATGKWTNFTVVVFPGGTGTKDMKTKAIRANVETIEYFYENNIASGNGG